MRDYRETIANLWQQLEQLGWAGRVIPIAHAEELRIEFEGRHNQGQFDEDFYREYLEWISFSTPEDFPGARTLIVIAVPAPQYTIEFQWQRRPLRLVLPPTYVGYRRTLERVRNALNDLLQPDGYRVADSRLPFKILAARSGLAEYGRNNILYRQGMGSFLQLGAYFSDIPCDGDPWQEPGMLERCRSCTACIRACPTGAIGRDRFLLQAERCITFHNEREAPLPGWIGTGWHNCLIGCMICQRACPENRHANRSCGEYLRFSEQETVQLLAGEASHPPAPELLSRWEQLGLSEDRRRIMRNLSAIINHLEKRTIRKS